MDVKELLKSREILHRKIAHPGFGSIPGFRGKYTGIGNPIGISTIYNSKLCSRQIEIALLISNHALVQGLLELDDGCADIFNPAPLCQEQVLREMKILDLGCGRQPTFARCARLLGADVYTADLVSAEDFEYQEGLLSETDRKLEFERHIQIDLEDPNTLDVIIGKSQGKFDFVTEAHLTTEGCYRGKELALCLLKKGGLYFCASYCFAPQVKD